MGSQSKRESRRGRVVEAERAEAGSRVAGRLRR
jgi:hypothetical protein